mmetsp:Transcript_38857/g.111622  ORF Transcript_38857/g.111622 Transcript_38857/m.111622 type:complete len:230 (-) Transcript_38857:1168-1857(-)
MLNSFAISGSSPSNPSRVMKVRHRSATYGGVSITYLLESFLSAVAMAPNRETPPLSSFICFASSRANSSRSHPSSSLLPFASLTDFNKGVGQNRTSCITLVSSSQSFESTLRIPTAKHSITPKSTRSMSPKSRKTTRPSSPSLRLPSCGSAWTKPVTNNCTTQASTAISTSFRLSSLFSSEGARLGYQSIAKTRAEPCGPVYSGSQPGELTKGKKACRTANSSKFAASS